MATDQAPSWEVTGQTEAYGLNSTGHYVHGVNVTFRTAQGITGTVFLSDAEYSSATAKERVSAQAAEVIAVSQLTG
jgi:hypothetical protein